MVDKAKGQSSLANLPTFPTESKVTFAGNEALLIDLSLPDDVSELFLAVELPNSSSTTS